MITDLSSKQLGFMEQSNNLVADGCTTMKGDVMAGLRDCQESWLRGGDGADHHAAVHQTISWARLDGEPRRGEWHWVQGVIRHGQGARWRGWWLWWWDGAEQGLLGF